LKPQTQTSQTLYLNPTYEIKKRLQFLQFLQFPLDDTQDPCYKVQVFRRSSAVEQLTVNQLVVGSIPTAGANIINNLKLIIRLAVSTEETPGKHLN
jgi:hypothetical protein